MAHPLPDFARRNVIFPEFFVGTNIFWVTTLTIEYFLFSQGGRGSPIHELIFAGSVKNLGKMHKAASSGRCNQYL
jgi:hypothetical protein